MKERPMGMYTTNIVCHIDDVVLLVDWGGSLQRPLYRFTKYQVKTEPSNIYTENYHSNLSELPLSE